MNRGDAMTCDEARTAAHEAIDGRLAGGDRPRHEAHLAACAACRAHAAGLARVGAAFAAAPLPGAPPDLLAGLGLAEAPPAVLPMRPRRRWVPLAGGLVAAALVAAVGLSVRPGTEPVVVAMSPTPGVEAPADAEAILTWFDADADYVDPISF